MGFVIIAHILNIIEQSSVTEENVCFIPGTKNVKNISLEWFLINMKGTNKTAGPMGKSKFC